jgi:hypothetical protein
MLHHQFANPPLTKARAVCDHVLPRARGAVSGDSRSNTTAALRRVEHRSPEASGEQVLSAQQPSRSSATRGPMMFIAISRIRCCVNALALLRARR